MAEASPVGASVPQVSVLMPARDAEATLPVALASVLKSHDVALEIVLVDHGSVDDTARIASSAGSAVVVVSVAPEVSFAEALERGRALCRAPFIARMDADDLMHPSRLREDLEVLLKRAELSAIACQVRPFPARDLGEGMRGYVLWQNHCLSPEDIAREIWVEQPLCHPSTTFRASALEAIGGYREGPFPEDYDLFLRLHLAGHLLAKRPSVHHGWRERPGRMTWSDPRYSRDALARRKVQAAIEHFNLAGRPVWIAGAGKEGGRVGRMLLAEGVSPAAYFDVSAARIGRVRHGAPTLDAQLLEENKVRDSDAFLVCAVGTSGSRAIVRGQAQRAGFVEPLDMICVA